MYPPATQTPPAMPPAPIASAPMPVVAASAQGLTLTKDEVKEWWSRIELARARRKTEADKWKKLLEGYLPPADGQTINSNIHFRDVELKKAELFAQLPDLDLQPSPATEALIDPQTSQPIDPYAATAAKRELLHRLLGRDYANVLHTIDAALFDVLATSGLGATMICYHADLQSVETQVPGPPTTMPGAVLGLQAVPGPMQTQAVDVPVGEYWRWEHFSSAAFLKPHDWLSTDYDAAPWLAREFCYSLTTAIREFKLPADFQPNTAKDDLSLEPDRAGSQAGVSKLVKGVLIWLHASEFDATVGNSQLFRELVLIEGQQKETRYRPSPYQDVDAKGRLTADSMIGNPIHPLTIRIVNDTAFIPSDSAVTDPLVKQENTWRQQDIKLRDANLPRFMHPDSLTQPLEKLKDADIGQGAGVPDETLRAFGDKIIVPLPKLERAESDVRGADAIRRDREETLGVGSNQAGVVNATVRSATEVATVQSNVTKRLRKERAGVMEWFLAGVARKFDPLVTRYGDLDNLTPIVGAQTAQLLLAWKAVSGRNGFDAKPDSQLSTDAAEDQDKFLKYQNFNAKNPNIDQVELSRIGAMKFGYDASRLVKPPQPSGPPPPNVSVKVDINDLAGPVGAATLKVLQQAGYQLTTADLTAAQANGLIVAQQQAAQQQASSAHGGAAPQAEKLSQHHEDLSGAMPGRVPEGAPAAQQPVGVQ